VLQGDEGAGRRFVTKTLQVPPGAATVLFKPELVRVKQYYELNYEGGVYTLYISTDVRASDSLFIDVQTYFLYQVGGSIRSSRPPASESNKDILRAAVSGNTAALLMLARRLFPESIFAGPEGPISDLIKLALGTHEDQFGRVRYVRQRI